jgi:hypothetical protein
MSCDLLLYWMTHTNEGSWAGFRKAISELMPDANDQNGLARQLRVTLSDLSHANFFIDGSQRWCVLPAMLAGLAIDDSAAVLCGSRTPELLHLLESAAHGLGCQFSQTASADGPSLIEVRGHTSDIQRVAAQAQITFVPRASYHLLRTVNPIVSQIENAPHDQQPFNWDVESFDLRALAWVNGLLPNAACRFTPRYGSPKFLLHRKHRTFLQMAKRDTVYASASIRGVELLTYSADGSVLTAPLAAPIPEKLARIACLCTGAQPRIERRALAYSGVPFDIASAVLVAAGQSHPGLQGLVQTRRLNIE